MNKLDGNFQGFRINDTSIETRLDDPFLLEIGEFFEKKGEALETINWHVQDGEALWGTKENIANFLESTDFTPLTESKKFIVLNSSGSYHHRTYFFIKALGKEITYIHIDAHPDCQHDSGSLHRANFVNQIKELPFVKKTYLLGITPVALHSDLGLHDSIYEMTYMSRPLIFNNKIEIYLAKEISDASKTLYSWQYEKLLSYVKNSHPEYFKQLEDFDPKTIPTKDVYITVDMDVIKGFPNEWRKYGRLTIDQVVSLISKISDEKNIIGANICGFGPKRKGAYRALENIYQIYLTLKR